MKDLSWFGKRKEEKKLWLWLKNENKVKTIGLAKWVSTLTGASSFAVPLFDWAVKTRHHSG